MRVTPTWSGNGLSGIGLWLLAWGTSFKLDALASACHADQWISRDKLYDWIADHKAISLITTELINIHPWTGIDGQGFSFCLGGTFVNFVMIYIVLPMRRMTRAFVRGA